MRTYSAVRSQPQHSALSSPSWRSTATGDGEGAGRLVTCVMSGARSEENAERLAKAVVGSSLVKAAMCGADANWGRVLAAAILITTGNPR